MFTLTADSPCCLQHIQLLTVPLPSGKWLRGHPVQSLTNTFHRVRRLRMTVCFFRFFVPVFLFVCFVCLFYFYNFPSLQNLFFGGFFSIFGGWKPLCKELFMAGRRSPHITVLCITTTCSHDALLLFLKFFRRVTSFTISKITSSALVGWRQGVVSQPKPRRGTRWWSVA